MVRLVAPRFSSVTPLSAGVFECVLFSPSAQNKIRSISPQAKFGLGLFQHEPKNNCVFFAKKDSKILHVLF